MPKETRKSVRYDDIGRVDAPELCPLPGILKNISADGCKVSFPIPITINSENDYEMKIWPTRISVSPFVLLCHPQWIQEENNTTQAGFLILRSPDSAKLAEYISQLQDKSTQPDEDDVQNLVIDSECQFI